MASALTFLKRYHKDGDEILNHITRETSDETWISFANAESKEQSKEWMHTHLPTKPRRFKQTMSACQKADGVSWETIGLLMVEFKQR
jgi:macrodomain Ter protein organizer (MatP/YcbG family)